MEIERDLQRIAQQEQAFQFEKFDAGTAWEIGARIKAAAEKRGVAVAFDITVNGYSWFSYAMTGTTLDHADWIRRKRNVAHRFQRPSYAVGLWGRRDGKTLQESHGASLADYAPHGGSFPIRLTGTGCIGTITVSGVPERDDHGIAVEALADFFGKKLSELALE